MVQWENFDHFERRPMRGGIDIFAERPSGRGKADISGHHVAGLSARGDDDDVVRALVMLKNMKHLSVGISGWLQVSEEAEKAKKRPGISFGQVPSRAENEERTVSSVGRKAVGSGGLWKERSLSESLYWALDIPAT